MRQCSLVDRQIREKKKNLSALSSNKMKLQTWTQLDTAVKGVRLHLMQTPVHSSSLRFQYLRTELKNIKSKSLHRSSNDGLIPYSFY